MSETNTKPRAIGLRIHDLAGLVVGYGLAALLVRSFRAEFDPLETGRAVAVVFAFVWLGLAMSGPVILLLDARRPDPPPGPPSTHPPTRYSGMELAWIGAGGYFIALTLNVVSARNHESPLRLIIFTQVFVSAILVVSLSIHSKRGELAKVEATRWTSRVACWLMLTWPIAWVALAFVFR